MKSLEQLEQDLQEIKDILKRQSFLSEWQAGYWTGQKNILEQLIADLKQPEVLRPKL